MAIDLDGDSLTYSWDATGGTILPYSNSSISWIAPTIEGFYTVSLTVSNNDGGIVEDSAGIMVTNGNIPFLTITSPTNGTTVTAPIITVTGTSSDPSGIASVTVDDVLANGVLDWSTWSAEVALVHGENTITVVATNNMGGSRTETVTVNNSVRGDLNSDGILTPADAAIALRLAATGGWDPAADVSGDNHITSLDALMILQAAGGAITL